LPVFELSPAGLANSAAKQPVGISLVHGRQPEPLDQRGWALQESLLSPRLLAFGSKGMTWRCQSDIVSKFPNGVKTSRPLPFEIFEPDPLGLSKSSSERRQKAFWHSLVEDYSGRELTLPVDRMLAISGIVSELALCWQDTYLAGLWRKSLVHSLAWRVVNVPANNSTPTTLAGPSWSWISHPFKVSFLPLRDITVEILDCTVQLLNRDAPFGDVASGKLVSKAYCETLAAFCVNVRSRPRKSQTLDIFFDDGSTYNLPDCIELDDMLEHQLALLSLWGPKAIGLVLQKRGEAQEARHMDF
jgi:hypothetical protein